MPGFGGDEKYVLPAVDRSGGECRIGARMAQHQGDAFSCQFTGDPFGLGAIAAVVGAHNLDLTPNQSAGRIDAIGGAARVGKDPLGVVCGPATDRPGDGNNKGTIGMGRGGMRANSRAVQRVR